MINEAGKTSENWQILRFLMNRRGRVKGDNYGMDNDRLMYSNSIDFDMSHKDKPRSTLKAPLRHPQSTLRTPSKHP